MFVSTCRASQETYEADCETGSKKCGNVPVARGHSLKIGVFQTNSQERILFMATPPFIMNKDDNQSHQCNPNFTKTI
jgi:hypothetical protein